MELYILFNDCSPSLSLSLTLSFSSLSVINLSGLISLKLVSGLHHLSDWLAFISAAV